MRTVQEIKLAIEKAQGVITLAPGELLLLVREIDKLERQLDDAYHERLR